MKGKLLTSSVGTFGVFAISLIACLQSLNAEVKTEPQTQMTNEKAIFETSVMESAEVQKLTDEEETETKSIELNDNDDYLLAKIAMAEAEDQGIEGKSLVMLVVINRRSNEGFPDTIFDVIYEKNQFSPIENGRFDEVEPDKECWEALELVKSGWDESKGALYFESKSESTWHEENLLFLFKYGEHYFYTNKEGGIE